MGTMNFQINDETRILLNSILDELIPANVGKGIPSAGSTNTIDFVQNAAQKDADLDKLFTDGLAKIKAKQEQIGTPFIDLSREDKISFIKSIEQEEPAFFEGFLRTTYMGYYSRPDVRGALGLSPKPVHPDGYDVPRESSERMEELTAPVKARGSVYRAV